MCRLAICHCEFNRGQWPQVTLVDLETHLVPCQGSHPVMYWHQCHQLFPFKSIAPHQVAFTHDFAKILSNVVPLMTNFVTWPDQTIFFYKKLRKRFPRSYGKFQHDSPNSVASSSEKRMGGLHQRPITRAHNYGVMGRRLKNMFFWTYRFLQTPRKILQFAVFWVPLSEICSDVLSAVPPTAFHNTISKNVNHSNDTIDNLNQSSFHKPARQCQGQLRTESFPASAHIFALRRKIRHPPISGGAVRLLRLKLCVSWFSTIMLPSCSQVTVQLSKSMYFILILLRNDKIVP